MHRFTRAMLFHLFTHTHIHTHQKKKKKKKKKERTKNLSDTIISPVVDVEGCGFPVDTLELAF